MARLLDAPEDDYADIYKPIKVEDEEQEYQKSQEDRKLQEAGDSANGIANGIAQKDQLSRQGRAKMTEERAEVQRRVKQQLEEEKDYEVRRLRTARESTLLNAPSLSFVPYAAVQKYQKRAAKLKFLLQRSGVYSKIMAEKMDKERKARSEAAKKTQENTEKEETEGSGESTSRSGTEGAPAGQNNRAGDSENKRNNESAEWRPKRSLAGKRKSNDEGVEISKYITKKNLKQQDCKGSGSGSSTPSPLEPPSRPAHARQPALVTGASMKDYQIDGFEWLVGLYENGLNGILADEMGLGKTLQTIAFLAHLRGKGVWGPFLIVAPLSTIANWVSEFERFAPDIPAMMYHAADKKARAALRHKFRYPSSLEEKRAFPVVVTSFEIAMMDRVYLSHLKWKYIVVDEGHRLKNMNCRLIQELKKFSSAQRLILTGTPLHNNLKELWSLLNFILPDIFDDLETFEKW